MDNEVISALPTGGQASSPLLRNFLIKRMVYSFEPTDDPSTFTALDGDTGSLPQVLAFNGSFFWLDPDDTTSDHDGVAVIATADGYRYKVDDIDYRTRSALSDTETDPPDSPSLGDVYLVPAGASGAWSSHQDDIAIWTRNGWRFEIPVIGKWLLIEDVGGFKGYYSDGWSYGPGARSFDDESVPLSASLGWGERVIVENQTTTTPPTATKGLRYIVGASAEGDWLGKDGQIAVCEVDGTWTFYSPSTGWAAYDKSAGSEYTFNGTSWVSSVGVWVGFKKEQNAAVSTGTVQGSVHYGNYGPSTVPTTSNICRLDDLTITYAAKKPNAVLRIRYNSVVSLALNTVPNSMVAALFRDSLTDAVEFTAYLGAASTYSPVDLTFVIQGPADTDSHTYKVGICTVNGSNGTNSYSRRTISIEELA